MIHIDIPGHGVLNIEYLLMDYNGTLACDGILLDGVAELLAELSQQVAIHIITADTFGKAQAQLRGVNCQLAILPLENQAVGKWNYLKKLDEKRTICIGNGRNDRLMLEHASLGIAVIQDEGAFTQTILHSDIVCKTIHDALRLLLRPNRLIATLRT